jgi:D-alanyl-D-alanine carboxypeptidase (penicillin-binding protein 5/6)
MKKIKITAIFLIFAALMNIFAPAGRAAEPEPFKAAAVFLAETTTGTVLYERNADERRAPDTLAKMMTLLLAAEAVERGELASGEVAENLFSAYVGSDDDACDAVATTVSGSVEAFVAAMNARAAELGCADTVFVNTNGKQDARQYTTARDLFRIARAGTKLSLFVEVAGARSHGDITNSNYMLNPKRTKYYYKYGVFGKVAATYENGYGAVEYAERDGLNAIAVVLGAAAVILETDNSTEMQNLTEARRLLEWGHANFSWTTALSSSELIARAAVQLGDGADFVNLRPEEDVVLLLSNDIPEDEITREILVFSEESGEKLTAPVAAGAELGEVVLLRRGEEIGCATLIADTDVRLLRVKFFTSQLKKILQSRVTKLIIIAVIAIFLAYAILVVRYQILRARYVKRRAEQARKNAESQDRERR